MCYGIAHVRCPDVQLTRLHQIPVRSAAKPVERAQFTECLRVVLLGGFSDPIACRLIILSDATALQIA